MAPLWTNQAFFKVFATLRQLQITNWLIIHFENFFRQLGIEPRPTPVTMDARRWNIDWLVEVQNVQNIRSSQWISLNRNSSIHSRIKWLIKVGRGSIPKCGTVTGGVIRAQFIDLTNAALIALIFRPTRHLAITHSPISSSRLRPLRPDSTILALNITADSRRKRWRLCVFRTLRGIHNSAKITFCAS